jgi:hypothetical protein
MKRILILLLLCIIGLHAFSQVKDSLESKTGRKLTKEQKLEKRRAEAEATAILVDWMVKQRRFVVEANYISDQTGNRLVVNSQLNFIRLDSSEIVIQIAPRMGRAGANGLGGITAEGSVSSWEIERFGKNKQMYYIRLFVRITRSGYYEIFLNINPDGSVQATLTGPDAAKIIFYGKLVSLRASKVYKGTSI